MVKRIKNILNLTKIFLMDSLQFSYIIDKRTNKINKKSIFVWLTLIVIMTITYGSYEIIKILVRINLSITFLNVFFLILNIIIIFQVVLVSTNIYFFSDDLKLILPLPIKPEDLIIAKFNTILINLYFIELIFAIFPLIIFGILTEVGIMYYVYLIIVLVIFPILINLIISIIMMFLIKLSKFIKNKDIFQIILTFLFILFVFIIQSMVMGTILNKLDGNLSIEDTQVVETINNFNGEMKNINRYFIEINSTVNILTNYNKINAIFYLLEIVFFDFIFLLLFILIGKKFYLKSILYNTNFYIKKANKNNIEKSIKKISKKNSYIKKELKILFRNPIFFIQCIFPTLILMVSIIIIVVITLPSIQQILLSDLFAEYEVQFRVDLSVICLILGFIQIIFMNSSISISAISREGKSAILMKFIPIDFYKQFIYKSIPQMLFNMICISVIIILIKLLFPTFDFIYLLFLFVLANLFNIISSKILVLINLVRPNLNWKSENEAIQQKGIKIFQYSVTIIIILLLLYFYRLFYDINLILGCFLICLILLIFNLILNKIIKVNINKLFKKVN